MSALRASLLALALFFWAGASRADTDPLLAGTPSAHATVDVPAVPTRVVDTVGAGDTFMGTLLDGILNLPGDTAAVRESVRGMDATTLPPLLHRAAAAAAITVGREGMDPPTREDLPQTAVRKESA